LEAFFLDIDFVVAHNISFDRNVLLSCCETYGITPPLVNYRCSVQLARKHLKIYPTNLAFVCKELQIELKHHDALSDALACAKITLAALAIM
jgi:DNA polymerase-3 subunit epsilon